MLTSGLTLSYNSNCMESRYHECEVEIMESRCPECEVETMLTCLVAGFLLSGER
jgi:hypothetical protein